MRKLIAAGIGILLAGVALVAGGGSVGYAEIPPLPTPIPPSIDRRMPVEFFQTGGPYIKESAAVAQANRLTQGPIGRQVVGMLTYAEAAAWMGSYTYTIAPQREFYLVVTEAPYVAKRGQSRVSCAVYFALVDATEGHIMSQGCKDRTNSWPALPPSLAAKT